MAYQCLNNINWYIVKSIYLNALALICLVLLAIKTGPSFYTRNQDKKLIVSTPDHEFEGSAGGNGNLIVICYNERQ